MSDPIAELTNHKPSHSYLICIDSDGCAFDSMEIKQKECFIPNIIQHWNLQAVSKYVREAAEFVNLYSKWRGVNRFPGLLHAFDLCSDRPEVAARGVKMPEVPNLRRWVDTEAKLGNPALEAYCETNDQTDMLRALKWSTAINDSVSEMVHGVPPFPMLRESLEKAKSQADLMVCSATPHDALVREWQEHDIEKYMFTIAGQEQGKKSEHIELASSGRYDADKILMIGDAPGDRRAAEANNALFYPINPGHEEASWQRFHDEALDKFFAGDYAGDYEAALIEEFEAYLPETPPWKA
jgi:phosphoglycolate phosphatase-like HAD superfamily hydrolase